MDRAQLADWLERYERAWRQPGTEGLDALFTAEASYSPSPYAEPHLGLEAIREMWEAERNPGEEFSVDSEVLAVEGDLGVVRLTVDYRKPRRQQYRDLWVVRLDGNGRCSEFEEWPFWPPGSGGAAAPGA
jgi:SnoaL-like domain